MQTATIQRRIETLPALRSGWKQSGEPCALKGACTVRREALGRPRQRRSAPTLRDRPRAPPRHPPARYHDCLAVLRQGLKTGPREIVRVEHNIECRIGVPSAPG